MGNRYFTDIMQYGEKRQLTQLGVGEFQCPAKSDRHLLCPLHMLFRLVIALRQSLRQRIKQRTLLRRLVHQFLRAHTAFRFFQSILDTLTAVSDYRYTVFQIRIGSRIVMLLILIPDIFKKSDSVFLLRLRKSCCHISVFEPRKHSVLRQALTHQICCQAEHLISFRPAEDVIDQSDSVRITYHNGNRVPTLIHDRFHSGHKAFFGIKLGQHIPLHFQIFHDKKLSDISVLFIFQTRKIALVHFGAGIIRVAPLEHLIRGSAL